MEISYLLDEFYQSTRVPASFFQNRELVSKSSYARQDFNLPLILLNGLSNPLPKIWYSYTAEYMYFGGLNLEEENGILFIGPVLLSDCLPRQAETILSRLGRSSQDAPALRAYFSENTTCDLPALLSHLRFLNYAINRKKEPVITRLPFMWNIPYPIPDNIPFELRQPVDSADSIGENALISYLRYGRLDAMEKLLDEHFVQIGSQSSLTMDYMRSYILSANVMASRTAANAGVDFKLATSLASHYMDKILQARTKPELSFLFNEFFRDYTLRVARAQQALSHSKAVRQINRYIQSHLYEKITPSILAGSLHRNSSYLCTHFRRETGKTISFYIQECKVKEAQRLMNYPDFTIVTIGEMLGFSSQSYFCSVFKKITGKTPGGYREEVFSGGRQ